MQDGAITAPGARYGLASVVGAIVVVAYCVVVQLWGVGEAPFHTKGEPREALVVWEMVHDGEWVLPRRNGIELPSKPPLFHWLGALVSLVHGRVDEWSVRLPSVLQSAAAALAVYLAAIPSVGPVGAGVATLILLSSFEWLRAATSARVDMTLTCGLTLALAALLELRRRDHAALRWLYHIGVAWAVVSKGPVGLALPVLHVLLLCGLDRRLELLRRLRPLRGLAFVLLVGVTWYALAIALGGEAFVRKQLLGENLQRFLGSSAYRAGHAHSPGYLVGALLAGLLPWTIFLPAVLEDWRAVGRVQNGRGAFVCLIAWGVVVFAFYAVAASKRGVYLLPLYPAVALLLGWWATQPATGAQVWLRRVVVPLAWMAATALALVALGAAAQSAGTPIFPAIGALLPPRDALPLRALGGLSTSGWRELTALVAASAAGAVLAACGARAGRRWAAIAGVLLIVAPASSAVQRVILPSVAQAKSRAAFVADLRRVVATPAELFFYRSFDYGVVFYWGRHLPVYDRPLTSAGPPYVLIGEADWRRAGADAHAAYERITTLAASRAGNLGRVFVLQRTAHGSSGDE